MTIEEVGKLKDGTVLVAVVGGYGVSGRDRDKKFIYVETPIKTIYGSERMMFKTYPGEVYCSQYYELSWASPYTFEVLDSTKKIEEEIKKEIGLK